MLVVLEMVLLLLIRKELALELVVVQQSGTAHGFLHKGVELLRGAQEVVGDALACHVGAGVGEVLATSSNKVGFARLVRGNPVAHSIKELFGTVSNTLGVSVVPADPFDSSSGGELEFAVALAGDFAGAGTDGSMHVGVNGLGARRTHGSLGTLVALVRSKVDRFHSRRVSGRDGGSFGGVRSSDSSVSCGLVGLSCGVGNGLGSGGVVTRGISNRAFVGVESGASHARAQLFALFGAFFGGDAPSALLTLPVVLLGAGVASAVGRAAFLGVGRSVNLVDRVGPNRFALVLEAVGVGVATFVGVRNASRGPDRALVVQASFGDLSDDSGVHMCVVGNGGSSVRDTFGRVRNHISRIGTAQLLVLATPQSLLVGPRILGFAKVGGLCLVLLEGRQLRGNGEVPTNSGGFEASTMGVLNPRVRVAHTRADVLTQARVAVIRKVDASKAVSTGQLVQTTAHTDFTF